MYKTPDLNNPNFGTKTSINKNKSLKAWCKISLGKKNRWNIYSKSHYNLWTPTFQWHASVLELITLLVRAAYQTLLKSLCTGFYSLILSPVDTKETGYLETCSIVMSCEMKFYCDHWNSNINYRTLQSKYK